jgi:hypothetical protein
LTLFIDEKHLATYAAASRQLAKIAPTLEVDTPRKKHDAS